MAPAPQDVPSFPFPKPRELEKLEQLPGDVIHAMTRTEMEEKIRAASRSLAKTYMSHTPRSSANYDDCFLLVSSALIQTGRDIPGQLGALLVGTSREAAEEACGSYFPDDTLRNG